MWQGSEQIRVAATPERVWAIVTDVDGHPDLAGSGEGRSIRMDGPLAVGTGWEAEIGVPKIAEPFTARSRVLSLDAPTKFTWTSIPLVDDNPDERPLVTWFFVITPSSDGCTVEHMCRVDAPKVG